MIINLKPLYLITATLLFFTFPSFAQDKDNLGTEVVNIVKPYTPEIGDAFKVKATPQLGDSINTAKKKVTYGIFSVPVASTFTPAKGRAEEIEKIKAPKLYDNYATLGFGTYQSALVEFYTNFEIDRDKNFGIYLNHNSSQGGIDDVLLDDKFYDTDLNFNYTTRNRDVNWITDLELEHQLYNWYGIDDLTRLATPQVINGINPTHSFYGAGLTTTVDLENSFFDNATATVRYFGDSEKSSEIRAVIEPTIEFPITDEKIKLGFKADYVNGKFDRNYDNSQAINYSHLLISGSPSLQVLRDNLTLNLGITVAVDLDTENSDTDFYFYPQVSASYRLADEYFTPYAGVEGGLKQNSYRDFTQQNPFVSPTLQNIAPTDEKYNAFFGVKGKLSSALSYNFRGNYGVRDNEAFFLNNPRYEDGAGNLGTQDYQYGNSFGVIFDDVRTFSFFGEINADVNSNFKLRLNAEYFSYNTDAIAEAWNRPDYKASLFGDYQISEQWYAGTTLFLVGERMDQAAITGPFISNNAMTVTLDGYFDANAHLGYRFNEQLSVFGRVNNILDNSYEKWLNTPVQGLQALLGATYKFDW